MILGKIWHGDGWTGMFDFIIGFSIVLSWRNLILHALFVGNNITFPPPLISVAVTPIVQLQIEVKKHIMRDERIFERINVFTATNKLSMTADIVQNNLQNYVSSYETDL